MRGFDLRILLSMKGLGSSLQGLNSRAAKSAPQSLQPSPG